MKKSNGFIMNTGGGAGNLMDEPLFIIHPGAISSILNLLPSLTSETNQHVNFIF
jgi:hypothetical protein